MAWVLCTDNGGHGVWINLANANRLEQSGDATMIYFQSDVAFLVRDTAADLVTKARHSSE
jgi:hypothetical protein